MLTAEQAKELACRSERLEVLFTYIEQHAKTGAYSFMLPNVTDEEYDTLIDLGYKVTRARSSTGICTIAWS